MREIHFTHEGQYLGRNGSAKAIGLEISENKFSNVIIITPVNSKNQIGSSFIAVPQSSIPELIDTLRLFVEGGSNTTPCHHNLITITAIDKHSSDTMSRTFNTQSATELKKAIQEFEKDLPYMRYELTTDEDMDDYPQEVIDILDEQEVTY